MLLDYSSYSLKHLEVAATVNFLSRHSNVIFKCQESIQSHFYLVQKT